MILDKYSIFFYIENQDVFQIIGVNGRFNMNLSKNILLFSAFLTSSIYSVEQSRVEAGRIGKPISEEKAQITDKCRKQGGWLKKYVAKKYVAIREEYLVVRKIHRMALLKDYREASKQKCMRNLERSRRGQISEESEELEFFLKDVLRIFGNYSENILGLNLYHLWKLDKFFNG